MLYICRAQHRGGWHPGKVHVDMCHFGWGGAEIVVRNYQVLAGYGVWRRPFGDLDRAYVGGGSGMINTAFAARPIVAVSIPERLSLVAAISAGAAAR